LYEYHFTGFAARHATGDWWRRERKGLYCPELSLRQDNGHGFWESSIAVGRHAILGTRKSKRGSGKLRGVQLALSASTRIDLPGRVRFAGVTNQRVGGQSRHSARARLSAGEAEMGADAFSANSDPLLVERE